MKLSDYVWNYVEELGVKHVFVFPGGGAMHLVDSLGRETGLRYVTMLHEQACSMAAETYSRISHNLGVVLVTTGPGGTNAITGVAAAWLESTPVIIISGQAKRSDLKGNLGVRQRGNQEIGIVDIVSSITKYAVTVMNPMDIKYHFDRAVYESTSGRPGPVWIDIPLDVQAADIDVNELRGFIPEYIHTNDISNDTIKHVIDLIKDSKRPIIIAGQGIERNNGRDSFRKLVETLGIPVLTSWIAVELLEYDNELNMGKPGMIAPRYSNYALQDSDLVIAIGTRLDPAMIGYNEEDFAPKAKKVVVDIDIHEINKFSFEIDTTICADATNFIDTLLENVEGFKTDENKKIWLATCQKLKREYPVVLDEFKLSDNKVNPYFFFDKLSDCLADDDVVIPGSSGAGIDIFWMCIKNKTNQRMLATGSLGSMGYGIPAAIGACLASGKRTICVEGDGSVQLNIQELATIKGLDLPIKIFINGNNGYLSIMNMQRNHFDGNFVAANSSSHLYLPDISKVAKAYGLITFELDNHESAESVIKRVLSTDGPVLCYVQMRDDIAIQPRVVSRVTEEGSMISGTLKDLWPYLD